MDSAGIENSLSIIDDSKIIEIFINALHEKQIIVADGHHRYEAALTYRKNSGLDSASNHAANRHLFFLTNTESNLLDIYPTIASFKEFHILKKKNSWITL